MLLDDVGLAKVASSTLSRMHLGLLDLPFPLLLQLNSSCLFCLGCDLHSDRRQERFQVEIKVLRSDSHLPVEEEEELLLHQVHLGDAEPKVLEATDGGVAGPVLVLWAGVVEVLRGKDE